MIWSACSGKKLFQTELATEISIHKNVLGKYEREEVKPSIDVAIFDPLIINRVRNVREITTYFILSLLSLFLTLTQS